ncbi:MAG: hypothetical protein BWY17_05229 [Deltaproteobacteria bacterium ADurb.Bin207]|nr:MAG: hypothetical protein BWY17_05229 [Deltaproteobacteria bacterium ADurb.Bin207]
MSRHAIGASVAMDKLGVLAQLTAGGFAAVDSDVHVL